MDSILVLDFGSQYTQLIARRIREEKVYCEIYPYNQPIPDFPKNLKGIVLSGGPSSVLDPRAPIASKQIFDLGIPLLGICYGLRLVVHTPGGDVGRSKNSEDGGA